LRIGDGRAPPPALSHLKTRPSAPFCPIRGATDHRPGNRRAETLQQCVVCRLAFLSVHYREYQRKGRIRRSCRVDQVGAMPGRIAGGLAACRKLRLATLQAMGVFGRCSYRSPTRSVRLFCLSGFFLFCLRTYCAELRLRTRSRPAARRGPRTQQPGSRLARFANFELSLRAGAPAFFRTTQPSYPPSLHSSGQTRPGRVLSFRLQLGDAPNPHLLILPGENSRSAAPSLTNRSLRRHIVVIFISRTRMVRPL